MTLNAGHHLPLLQTDVYDQPVFIDKDNFSMLNYIVYSNKVKIQMMTRVNERQSLTTLKKSHCLRAQERHVISI